MVRVRERELRLLSLSKPAKIIYLNKRSELVNEGFIKFDGKIVTLTQRGLELITDLKDIEIL